jgi:hypothetical protein
VYHSVSKTLLLLLITFRYPPKGENFAYWSASFQRAGKWFSSSPVLSTDIAADIADRLSSDMPCFCARCHHSSYFHPTWWAHNPQVHRIETWLFCATLILLYHLHLASYVIHELIPLPCFILVSNTMLFSLFKPPFQFLSRHRMIAYPFETLVPSYITLNDLLNYNSWGTSCNPHWVHRRRHKLCGDTFFQGYPPCRVHRTMKTSKEG